MSETNELPAGWITYGRETDDGEHWTGELYGPHGFSTRLGATTEKGLIAKILAREDYRVANGFSDASATAIGTKP